MCGIFGTSRITPQVAKMLPLFGWEMQSRGKDSWGASDGVEMIHQIGPLEDSWDLPTNWERGIFHTRAASHGSAKDLENCHPFQFWKEDGSSVIGIHNGLVSNHKALQDKYHRDFKVDSKHIFANLAEGKGVGELEGWMALAWWEDGELNFARSNTEALHIAQLEGGEIVFCSTFTALQKISKMFKNPIKINYKVEEFHHYRVEGGGGEGGKDILVDLGVLPFPKKSSPQTTITTYRCGGGSDFSYISLGHSYDEDEDGGLLGGIVGNGVYGHNPYNSSDSYYRPPSYPWKDGVCYICRKTKIDVEEQVICEGCLDLRVEVFKQTLLHQEGSGNGGGK